MFLIIKKKHFILVRLFIVIVWLSSVRTESVEEDDKSAKSDISEPFEAKNSEELSIEGKSADEVQDTPEIRVERSSDESSASDKSRSGKGGNLRRSSLDDNNQKSAETFRKDDQKYRSNFEKDTDDLDIDRSEKNMDEEDIEDKTASEDEDEELSNKKDDSDDPDFDEKSGEDEIVSSRTVPYKTQDAILDSKARIAHGSAEKSASPENDEGFDLRPNHAANIFGSRRSFSSDSSHRFGPVSLERSGDIFNEPSLQIPEKPSFQFTKIPTQETFLPYPLMRPPLKPLLNPYIFDKVSQNPNDGISSDESKPLEEFNFNPYSNAYPLAYKSKPSPLPTTPTPVEVKKPADLLPVFPQSLQIYPPQVKFVGENLRQFYPVTFKPPQPNLPFPSYNTFLSRYNNLPTPPYFNPPKCSLCS